MFTVLYHNNMFLLTTSIQDESDRRPDETQAWIRDQPRYTGNTPPGCCGNDWTPRKPQLLAGKPDRQDHYIISRQGCQDKWRKNGKKRGGICTRIHALIRGRSSSRLAQAGCLSYSSLPDTTPALSKDVKCLLFYSAQRLPCVDAYNAICLESGIRLKLLDSFDRLRSGNAIIAVPRQRIAVCF